jgi:hypothetical protein
MKVRELIDELLKLNGDTEVMIRAPLNYLPIGKTSGGDLDLPVIGVRTGYFVSQDGNWAMIVGTDAWGQNEGRLK